MASVTASIQFEAESMEEANGIIASWTLSPGCQVYAHVTMPVEGTPAVTDEGGNLVKQEPQAVPTGAEEEQAIDATAEEEQPTDEQGG